MQWFAQPFFLVFVLFVMDYEFIDTISICFDNNFEKFSNISFFDIIYLYGKGINQDQSR